MRNQWAQKTYDEVYSTTNLDDVNNIFNGIRYLTKAEIGAIIGEIIGNFNSNMNEKLSIILKSKKYNENLDCVSELQDSVIMCLFKAFFNNIKNGNTTCKNHLKSFILDDTINYCWGINDEENNSILHILMENCNLLNDKELDEFLSIIPLEHFSLLNKNNNNENVIKLFKDNNRLKTNNKKKKIIELLNKHTDNQSIEIDISAYVLETV